MTSPLVLPPETVDYIIDFLHDDRKTLKSCCLTSSQFVPRTRKHLFKDIVVNGFTVLQQWNEIFPDPAPRPETKTSLSPFHILLAVKYLCICGYFASPLEIFELIYSLPHLEDLDVTRFYCNKTEETNRWRNLSQALTSPPLTGTLLIEHSSLKCATSLLSALPAGLRFREIVWIIPPYEEPEQVEDLIEACSDTLESIYIEIANGHVIHSIDLSKAIKLKEVTFEFSASQSQHLRIRWITGALKKITSERRVLQQISFHVFFNLDEPEDVMLAVGEEIYQEWMDLDSMLVRICQSHTCHVKAVLSFRRKWRKLMQQSPEIVDGYIDNMKGCTEKTHKYINGLLPEMTKGGLIDVVRPEYLAGL